MAPAAVSGESEVLVSCLHSQRDHVLGILDGLREDALRRPALPSGWTPWAWSGTWPSTLERFWFRAVIAGEQPEFGEAAQAWQVGQDTPPEAVFSLYRQEISRANQIIAATPLETPPARWPEEWSNWAAGRPA